MKKHIKIVPLLLLVLGLFAFGASASAAAMTENQLANCQRDFNAHDYCLSLNHWANATRSGKAAVTAVQKLLDALGYDVGGVDGCFGAKTERAVKNFQKENGLLVDGVVGNGTFNSLLSAVKTKLNTSPVRDLKITGPNAVTIAPGESTTLTLNFSGVGIDSVGGSLSGGLKGRFLKASWKAYPQTCSVVVQLEADKDFTGGSFTLNLKNNQLVGVIKSHSVKVSPAPACSYDLDAMLTNARKYLGMTGSDLGYTEPWCAYFVGRILRSIGLSENLCKGANGCDLAIDLLEADVATYYSFRHANVDSLIRNGLSCTDNVISTSRSGFNVQKGDILIYLWEDDEELYNWSHVGFVASNDTTNGIRTIEGNTGGGRGIVSEQNRSFNSEVVGILRLK